MKKLLSVLLIISVLVAGIAVFAACDKDKGTEDDTVRVAMITDYGDITDQSFNQTTYEACRDYCNEHTMLFKYYKPSEGNTEARVASVHAAIAEGFNVIVMPGFAFAETVVQTAGQYPNVKFVALDVGKFDLDDADPSGTYNIPANVYCAVYQEELAGFMAGYAAVKEGYRKLGFLGGMAVPAVIRFGFGYVQGANKAADEMGIVNEVTLDYVYGNQFFGDADITAKMDTWYSGGTEVVFACGGGIYTSACDSAAKVHGKVIGVDTDQSAIINEYEKDMCITSAMKGLRPTVLDVLKDIVDGKWSNYGGKVATLGLVSGTDVEANYVQLPTATWSMKEFKLEDYKDLVKKMYDGEIKVSGDTTAMPEHLITVNEQGNIK